MSRLELQLIDTISAIRQRPDMYLPYGELRSDTLSTRLVYDITSLYQSPICILQHESWWVIACEQDWIVPSLLERNLIDYFTHVIPFPEAGVNTMHGEVLLTAFAADLVTATPSELVIIKGSSLAVDLKAQLDASFPNWQRFVAFRL